MIHLKPVLDGRGQPGREALGSQMGVRAGAVAPKPECRLARLTLTARDVPGDGAVDAERPLGPGTNAAM